MFDTICAISTTPGYGAISIIKISGEQSISIVDKIFTGVNLSKQTSHTINYGYIKNNEIILDEVLVMLMRAPKTFTREDVVEINCHGGYISSKKILELLVEEGCRLAEPGEFSKRAFLNGRTDLMEAEYTNSLITSTSDLSHSISVNSLTQKTSNKIKKLREDVFSILANIMVNIDHPEYYDIEDKTVNQIEKEIQPIKTIISKIILNSNTASIIEAGLKLAIIGAPNVGKSSILNQLLEENKAIVTSIPGTTRDMIEGNIILNNIPIKLIDTAGIRKTHDKIEQLGISKTKTLIKEADMILFILNNNKKLTKSEEKLLSEITIKPHIVIINKMDLKSNLILPSTIKNNIFISAKKGINIENLKDMIIKQLNAKTHIILEIPYTTNINNIAKLKECETILLEIEKSIKSGIPVDILEIDLKRIWNLLGEITGESYEDELLDNIFNIYCLGK